MKLKLEIEHYFLLAFGLFCVLLLSYLGYKDHMNWQSEIKKDKARFNNCTNLEAKYELSNLSDLCLDYEYSNQ